MNERNQKQLMDELIKPEKGVMVIKAPKVYKFAACDNLFNATLEKDPKKKVMRQDNGPRVEVYNRFQDTILVSSEAGLCKTEIKN